LHGLSDTLSPTRLVLLKARGKTLQKEYEMVKKSKKTEQEIEDFIKGTSSVAHNCFPCLVLF
ncbi:hypothetical protein OFN13_33735, partial [Escherichia coli]|nr:hypothetical protein [Escherichia coli]